jgi:hypothetical protein
MHIDSAGDSLSSAYMDYNNLFRISQNSFLSVYTKNDTGVYDTSFVSEIDTNGNENILFSFQDSTEPSMNKIIQTSDSLYLIAGTEWHGDTSFAKILKTDRTGHVMWQKEFLSQTLCGQNVQEVYETSAHDYILMSYHACCCHTYPGNILIARLDTAGNTEWIYGSADDWVSFYGQLIEDNGEFIFMGHDTITRLSSTGNVVWKKPNGMNGALYVSLAKSISDGFYACGLMSGLTGKAVITKFNDSGDSLHSYVFTGQHDIYGEYMRQLPDGRLACIGGQTSDTSGNGNPRQTFFLVCDSNGTILSASDRFIETQDEVSVFPNPTDGNFNIQFSNFSSPQEMVIYNSYGQEILRKEITNSRLLTMRLNNAAGLYFLKVSNGNKSAIYRVMKY